MQVERGLLVAIRGVPSGEWVSNTWVTCPEVEDNSSKGLLILRTLVGIRCLTRKAKGASGGACGPSVVGGVMAYQADDG